jgi:CO/xanthine dehydrogenase Mo-binding subunit
VAIENCNGPYRIPNIEVQATAVYTNNCVASAFRGFGAPQVLFAIESQLDILAQRLKLDPIELRLRNALRKGDLGVFRNRLVGSVGITRCLQQAASHELWARKKGHVGRPARPWLRRGVGVAAAIKGYTLGALPDRGRLGVELTPEGRFRVKFSSIEMGQGVLVALTQIAAEVLHCNIAAIEPVFADTAATPDTSVTSASRQLYLAGNALLDAGRKMLRRMREAVHASTRDPADSLTFSNARVIASESGREFTYAEVASLFEEARMAREVGGEFEVPRVEPLPGTLEIPHLFYMFAVALALVEVNTRTGFTRVLRFVSIPDAGKVVNPQTLEGQLEGAAVQGVGYALMEEAKIARGVLKTTNFATYLTPTIMDMPDLEVIAVEEAEDTGPFGAKGIGEIGIVPVAPAIANAIADAAGIRPTSLPMTPEKLYWLLKQREETRQDVGA